MKLAIYLPTAAPGKRHVLRAFAEGVPRLGDEAVLVESMQRQKADLAVGYSLPGLKAKTHLRQRLLDWHGRALVLDGGLLCPASLREAERHSRWWWGEAGQFQVFLYDARDDSRCYGADDAPGDRLRALGYTISPWRSAGRHILLCGSMPGDLIEQGLDPASWTATTVAALRRLSPRPIRYRPHPGDRTRRPLPSTDWAGHEPFAAALDDAWVAVGLYSSALARAVLAGVPAIALSPLSPAAAVAGCALTEVEAPPRPDRTAWAHALGYMQWRPDELAAGLAWRRLKELC